MPQTATNYPVYPNAVQPLPDPMDFSRKSHDILANAVPGLDNLTAGASGVVNNLLGGMPSPSVAQRANAYYGGASGMPSSDYVRNRGVDLYGQQADQYRQRGFDDFLQLLRGTSGTIAPTPGEQLQSNQFDRTFQQGQIQNNQQVGQFNANFNKQGPDITPYSSNDAGEIMNRAGQRIRTDPSFRINKGIFV